MLQHSQIRLTTPSNATELIGADLVQINGGQPSCGWGGGWGGGCGSGWGGGCGSGWGGGCGWGWPSWGFGGGSGGGFGGFGGLNNTILINIDSFNRSSGGWW